MIDLSKFDLLQDRDNDESYTNGIWDLSYEVCNEKMEQEEMYNFLQEFKEKVLAEKDQEHLWSKYGLTMDKFREDVNKS